MKKKTLSILLWILAVIFTLGAAYFQRLTGPTKPMRGTLEINNQEYNYRLIRTWGEDSGAEIKLGTEFDKFDAFIIYKRYKSFDKWDTLQFNKSEIGHSVILPQLPPAGKIIYQIKLQRENQDFILNQQPAILRYKGSVPLLYLLPHIILMYLAMLFSMRTGFEAIFVRKRTYMFSILTLIFLVTGGVIFGGIVQKFAFGAFWTGWPFGTDLTDNKTAIAIIFWTLAVIVLTKKRNDIIFPVLAALILFFVYLIPHSLRGSSIDFRELESENKTEIVE